MKVFAPQQDDFEFGVMSLVSHISPFPIPFTN